MDIKQRVRLGRSDVTVTRVGLGTNALGNLYQAVRDDEAEQVISTSLSAGIAYFDTAPLYGYGRAEERLGRALSSVPRSQYALSTKVGRLLRDDVQPPPAGSILMPTADNPLFKDAPPVFPVFDFTHDGVMRSIDESLTRLAIDRIDLLYIHDPDDHFAEVMAGAYPALAELRAESVVGAIGVGMNQAQLLTRFATEADFDCFLLAGRYTLLDQSALAELFPVCEARKISIVAGGIFNSGVLADPESQPHYDYGTAPPGIVARAGEMRAVCSRYGVPLPAAAFQFVAAHPVVASVVLGPRSVTELNDDLRYAELDIPQDLWDELRGGGFIASDAPVPSAARSSLGEGSHDR